MRFLALLPPLLLSTGTAAEQPNGWSEKLQIHGFASQGYIHTTDNQFFGDSEDGSFEFTEMGINGSFQLSPRLRLAGQVISRRVGEFSRGAPHLDYALLDINLINSTKGRLGTYLGRIKNPVGLFNETRDVAHTREGILLPQTIYFDKVRDLIMSADGFSIYGDYYLDRGVVMIQTGMGYPLPDKNVEYTYMGRDWAGNLNADKPGLFGKLLYEHDGGRWIYSLTGATITIDFDRGAADTIPFPFGPGLNTGEIEIDYTVLSTQYNGEKWQFTAEMALEDVDYINISDSFAAQGTNSIGYYAQLNYKFTPQWQTYLRFEEFQFDTDDWDGKEAAQNSLATSQFLLTNFGVDQPAEPAHTRFSKIWTLGGRWDINPNLMMRAEYQLHDGTAILSPRENNMALTKGIWDLFAVSIAYKF